MTDRSDRDVLALLPDLMRYARMLTRDDGAAEDLLNTALLRAHEARASYDPSRPLRRWLFAILHNAFVSDRRRQQAEQRTRDAFAELVPSESPPAQEHTAQLAEVTRRFEALPDGQRETLYLIVVEGLGYQEAADALGVPVGTVMSRLSRARRALRADIGAPDARRGLRVVGGKDAD